MAVGSRHTSVDPKRRARAGYTFVCDWVSSFSFGRVHPQSISCMKLLGCYPLDFPTIGMPQCQFFTFCIFANMYLASSRAYDNPLDNSYRNQCLEFGLRYCPRLDRRDAILVLLVLRSEENAHMV